MKELPQQYWLQVYLEKREDSDILAKVHVCLKSTLKTDDLLNLKISEELCYPTTDLRYRILPRVLF